MKQDAIESSNFST